MVFVGISNRHSVYGLGKVSTYHRAHIVAGVSRDKRSVSTSMSNTCIVCNEASEDDRVMYWNRSIRPLVYNIHLVGSWYRSSYVIPGTCYAHRIDGKHEHYNWYG